VWRATGESGLSPDLKSLPSISPTDRTAVSGLFLLALVTSAASLPGLFEQGSQSGRAIGSYSLQWVGLLALVILVTLAELIILMLVLTGRDHRMVAAIRPVLSPVERLRIFGLVGFGLPWIFYVGAVFYRLDKNLVYFLPRVWLFLLAAAVGAIFLSILYRRITYFWAVLATALLYGAGIKALGYLPDISDFPFSLSWSEASRYYYASLPYARSLFGIDIPLSPWHPSRYLLQGIAFWIPGAPIWLHRLWQVTLWLGMPALTGLVFARRFCLSKEKALLVVIWSALFLLQGPVYYHLLVCVILVLWGFDARRFWKTLVFVVLASIWAGISRVNWIPVPAFLAAALYLLEVPVASKRGWLHYVSSPLAWGITGGAAALLAQAVYLLVSGHEDTSVFGSSFNSALLWYRLFPNPTYPMGVLPAILLVSLPLLLLVAANWVRMKADWHPLRILGLSAVTLILFAGGLVVSTKIGGGSNIHNMDAFIVLLMVIGASVSLGRFATETGSPVRVWRPWMLALVIIAVPVIWNLNIGSPFARRNFDQAAYDLSKLSAIVQEYAPKGDVLFITQRQLVVFGLIPGVKVVPEYELLTLTEMAISNNQVYLERFSQDLARHRFALIVMDYHFGAMQDPLIDAFAEENNAWRENVNPALERNYQSEWVFDTQGIELFTPREARVERTQPGGDE
jgi:hypothetical protein